MGTQFDGRGRGTCEGVGMWVVRQAVALGIVPMDRYRHSDLLDANGLPAGEGRPSVAHRSPSEAG